MRALLKRELYIWVGHFVTNIITLFINFGVLMNDFNSADSSFSEIFSFITFYGILVVITVSNAYAGFENSGNSYFATLPFSRSQFVLSRYIVSLLPALFFIALEVVISSC